MKPLTRKPRSNNFCAFAALGLKHYTLRFIDAGEGIQNAMLLSYASIEKIQSLQREYGLSVSSLGSPIGKVKLIDKEDGSNNRYVPFHDYLAKDVVRACDLANPFWHQIDSWILVLPSARNRSRSSFGTGHRSIRSHRVGMRKHGLTFGLEVEPT